MFLHSEPYGYKSLRRIIGHEVDGYKLSHKKKGFRYYEIPCAFDIETSSFYENGEKRACMYIWQFGINGYVFIGRTWRQFRSFINDLCDLLSLGDEYRLIVGVHNLAYEFQFIRGWFDFENVFAVKSRTPVYALTVDGIEFRCTYLLSGYSLAKLGENLNRYHVNKLVGDLDYNKIRNSKTPLTAAEIGYCVNDVLVVMAYLQEKIEEEGSIIKIPYTKTGYVRRYCRNACFYEPGKQKKRSFKRWKYTSLMHQLSIEPEEYRTLKRAFQGGFTHAGGFYSGLTVDDVTSYDFTSSYPYALISEQYPMSKGELVTIRSEEELYNNLRRYCCMFDLDLYEVTDSFIYDHYISRSKCFICENAVIDNGRIVSADHIRITVTEQDFAIIRKTYTWKKAEVRNFWRYHKGYLPSDLVRSILKLYADKTQLKGIDGKEVEYLNSKEMLNSVYGCMVTDIIRPENEYKNGRWLPPELPDIVASLNSYNSGYGRFNFYPWGVWCTAFSRRNLWTGIIELGEDYIYSDTDSIKGINMPEHLDYIEAYNRNARKKLENACKYHGIDIFETEPETVKGVKKPLGVWDYDGHYQRFKTLGAKRYMVQDDSGTVNITVSGLNKRVTVPFLCEGWHSSIEDHLEHDTPFDRFSTGLYVPAEYTGKNTHTYIDTPHRGRVTDYLGNSGSYYEKSCIHLEGADYSLSIAQEYIEYILGLEDVE